MVADSADISDHSCKEVAACSGEGISVHSVQLHSKPLKLALGNIVRGTVIGCLSSMERRMNAQEFS